MNKYLIHNLHPPPPILSPSLSSCALTRSSRKCTNFIFLVVQNFQRFLGVSTFRVPFGLESNNAPGSSLSPHVSSKFLKFNFVFCRYIYRSYYGGLRVFDHYSCSLLALVYVQKDLMYKILECVRTLRYIYVNHHPLCNSLLRSLILPTYVASDCPSFIPACLPSLKLRSVPAVFFAVSSFIHNNSCVLIFLLGRDSSVDIANRYGLDGLWIESRWRRNIPQPSRPALRPTQSSFQWIPGLFLGVKRPGCGVDNPPLSSAVAKEILHLCLYCFSGTSRPAVEWSLPLPLSY